METQVSNPVQYDAVPEPFNSAIDRAQNRLTLMENDLRRLGQFKFEEEEACSSLDKLKQSKQEEVVALNKELSDKKDELENMRNSLELKNKEKIDLENKISELKIECADLAVKNENAVLLRNSIEKENKELSDLVLLAKKELVEIKERTEKAKDLLKQVISI